MSWVIGFIPRFGFNLDIPPFCHMPSTCSSADSERFGIVELITSLIIDIDIFANEVARDWFSKGDHERLCIHLSYFENKPQICWIRSRLGFLTAAEPSTILLHISTLLMFSWIFIGAMTTFVVENNHVGFVVVLRKFKNSILNFVLGYLIKWPAGIQHKILLQNILMWTIYWDICTLTSKTFCYEIFYRWTFYTSEIQQILLWTVCWRIYAFCYEISADGLYTLLEKFVEECFMEEIVIHSSFGFACWWGPFLCVAMCLPLEGWLCLTRICFGEFNPKLDIGLHRPMSFGAFLSLQNR